MLPVHPPAPPPLLSRLLRPLSSFLLGHIRLFGWLPIFLYFLSRHPRRTLLVYLLWFHFLSRSRLWCELVRRWCTFSLGGSAKHSRYQVIKTTELDSSKTYILVGHPHGLLAEGIIYPLFFDQSAMQREFPSLPYAAVAGSQLGWLPLYRELFDAGDPNPERRKVSSPEKSNIYKILHEEKRSIGIFPGGFSEAVYSSSSNRVEYAYIKDRAGFLRLAIECGVDVVPVYSFGVSRLYWTPKWLRGIRSRLAQTLRIPMIPLFLGDCGTMMPKGDFTIYTVVGRPFPTSSKYTIEQLDVAHADYLNELQSLYETYKRQFGEDKDLVFIGKDFKDNSTECNFPAIMPNWMRRITRMQSQIAGTEAEEANHKLIREWKEKQRRLDSISRAALDRLTTRSGNVSEWQGSQYNWVVSPPQLKWNETIDYTKPEWIEIKDAGSVSTVKRKTRKAKAS